MAWPSAAASSSCKICDKAHLGLYAVVDVAAAAAVAEAAAMAQAMAEVVLFACGAGWAPA